MATYSSSDSKKSGDRDSSGGGGNSGGSATPTGSAGHSRSAGDAAYTGTGATGVAPGTETPDSPDAPDRHALHTAADDDAEQLARETWDRGPSQHMEPLPDEMPIPVNREQFDADGISHNPVDNAAGPYDVTKDEEAQRAAKIQADPTTP